MLSPKSRRVLTGAGLIAGAILAIRYALPLLLPFLAAGILALSAEPAVCFLQRRMGFRRGIAAFFGVSLTLALLTAAGFLLLAALFRGFGWLAAIVPDLESAAGQGITALQDWLLSLASAAPEGLRSLLTKAILGLFRDGGNLLTQAAGALPGLVAGLLSRITGGFLGIGTGILAAYLISARLPDLRAGFQKGLPERWKQQYLPALSRLRTAAGGWLKAQARLMLLTYCLVLGGLAVLGIRYAPVWAALIALVDAVPMLGTGLILLPWSLICLLQDAPLRAAGLVGIFAAATLARTVLEPRLVGKQLGLDPLVTLVSLYLGYQLLGFPGLLLAPLVAVAVTQFLIPAPQNDKL